MIDPHIGVSTTIAPDQRPAPSDLRSGRRDGRAFHRLCQISAWSSVAILAVLLGAALWKSAGWLDRQFVSSFDSAIAAEKAGIVSGIWGSFWLMICTAAFSVPVGVGAALYLEEYAADTWVTRLIRTNLANLAGVPSIVYGILGLTVFVRMLGLFGKGAIIDRLTGGVVTGVRIAGVSIPLPFQSTVISGALTLGLLVLPVIIVATQEALRAVPPSIRHASLALGATRWQTIRHQVLPAAVPGILTGTILALSRAIGEAAPLILVGAATFLRTAPGGITNVWTAVREPQRIAAAPFDEYTAMPIQIFNWAKQIDEGYRHAAAAGVVVLLATLLLMNGMAILIRNRYQKRTQY